MPYCMHPARWCGYCAAADLFVVLSKPLASERMAILEETKAMTKHIRQQLKQQLPHYMIPRYADDLAQRLLNVCSTAATLPC